MPRKQLLYKKLLLSVSSVQPEHRTLYDMVKLA